MAKAKLKELLHKYQGKEYKLEKQKRLQKEAEKRKQKRAQQQIQDGSEAEKEGNGDADLDEQWEDASESLHSESGGIPLPDESDSDSELDFQEASQDPSVNGENENSVDLEDEGEDEEEDDDDNENENEDEEDGDSRSDIALSDISSAGSVLEDVVPHQRLTINNTAALERALKSFAVPDRASLPFSELQSVTTSEPVSIPDIDDDLNRELAFYSQSLSAAKEGRRRLLEEGIPFTRPSDYFAEMIKSDEHMDKVKAKMVEDASNKKAAAEARRQRDLRKFGKQVQQEKLKERAQAKNQMLEKVKLLKRKRQGEGLKTTEEEDLFDVALEDAVTSQRKNKDGAAGRRSGGQAAGGGGGGGEGGRSAKRQKKDAKFGFGGKKRFKKSGDAISSADMKGYSVRKMKDSTRGKPKRLGKSRRAARAR